jgi:hypothetical protein
MDGRYARKEAEVLTERLMSVENAIFYLKVKSTCFPRWDNSEVERLERLQVEIRTSYERLYQQGSRMFHALSVSG